MGVGEPSQIAVTVGKRYEICALSRWRNIVYFQVVDDLGYPTWLPAWLFHVDDGSLPADWICTLLEGAVEMIIGPRFIAEDEATYQRMVELDPESVSRFWQRYGGSEHGGEEDEGVRA